MINNSDFEKAWFLCETEYEPKVVQSQREAVYTCSFTHVTVFRYGGKA